MVAIAWMLDRASRVPDLFVDAVEIEPDQETLQTAKP
jgi:hypothetical protein